MKKKINIQQATVLLQKYYEGLTSGAEEQQLHEFLQQKNLPEQFEADSAIFGYFAQHKAPATKSRFKIYVKWAGVAAAVFIAALLIIQPLIITQQTSYAYIDGKKTTDREVIQREALFSLRQISETNETDIINYQLSIFN